MAKIETGIKQVLGEWAAWFKIGNQGFTLCSWKYKYMAKYHLRMLKRAFKRLENEDTKRV